MLRRKPAGHSARGCQGSAFLTQVKWRSRQACYVAQTVPGKVPGTTAARGKVNIKEASERDAPAAGHGMRGAMPCPPGVPVPPHALERREPLPTYQPKSVIEDPQAMTRIEAIMGNFSYLPADQDVEFLDLDDMRGVRLQLDYQKTELLLREHQIEHTIVVFGSTRIKEPEAARRAVQALREQTEQKPDCAQLATRLAVAERIAQSSHYYEIARTFGRMVAEAQQGLESRDGGRLAIMTGGGPGLMEAANRGAFEGKGKSIGLNIHLPREQFPNLYLTPGLCFQFHYFALRKLHFLLRTRALVAFPGGYGTMDELFETLTLVQTRKIKPVPIILVGRAYWERAFDVQFLVEQGVIAAEDRDLFWYAETAQEIWDGILAWYELKGEPLLPSVTTDKAAR